MPELTSITEEFVYKTADGKVLLQAPLLALSYYLGFTSRGIRDSNPDIDLIAMAEIQVPLVNKRFNCNLDWWQLIEMGNEVQKVVTELKKKNGSQEQESQRSTRSMDST